MKTIWKETKPDVFNAIIYGQHICVWKCGKYRGDVRWRWNARGRKVAFTQNMHEFGRSRDAKQSVVKYVTNICTKTVCPTCNGTGRIRNKGTMSCSKNT